MQKLRLDSKDIAHRPTEAGGRLPPQNRQLAAGDGWVIADVLCTAGPQNRPFEEQHSRTSIAIVLSGTFQYRTSTGRELMTPGALLLGNAGDCFICGHEHGTGDRCVAFSYSEEFCERFASHAGVSKIRFKAPRLAPARDLSPLVVRAAGLLAGAESATCEEVAAGVLARAIQAECVNRGRPAGAGPGALARVTRVVRMIENDPEALLDLRSLAQIARLSPYHFLRTFETITGTTPHQYLLRVRLRRAAARLRSERTKVVDIALGGGFGDVSNFNRAFRAEFGVSPRVYRSMAW